MTPKSPRIPHSLFDLPAATKTYTVLELNTAVRKLLRLEFPAAIWVCGEIKDLRASRNKKHIYFDLIQKHPEADEIMAKVSAAIFEGCRARINGRIEETKGAFELKNDIEVRFLCQVDLYPKSGQYSLIVTDIEPAYTLGKFAQNRQRIIKELERKGLIQVNKANAVPGVPLAIGLITASDSAAYHDFLHELTVSGFGFKVLVCNCHMQGAQTEPDVVAALQSFNKLSENELDVVVITRGGGSTADLSWFDNKKIAERIALCKFPVLTALGHHINISVTDLVAHTFFKTPTKVAQFLVERVNDFLSDFIQKGSSILTEASVLLEKKSRMLEARTLKIDSLVAGYFQDNREQLMRFQSLVINTARNYVEQKRRKMQEAVKSLRAAVLSVFQNIHLSLRHREEKITLLDPRNILRRGYSISYKGKKAITSAAQLAPGDMLRTVFLEGETQSRIEKIKENDE